LIYDILPLQVSGLEQVVTKAYNDKDSRFESCSLRMQKLLAAKYLLGQLQLSQLFYNTENTELLPAPLTQNHPEHLCPSNNGSAQYSTNNIYQRQNQFSTN